MIETVFRWDWMREFTVLINLILRPARVSDYCDYQDIFKHLKKFVILFGLIILSKQWAKYLNVTDSGSQRSILVPQGSFLSINTRVSPNTLGVAPNPMK